MFHLKNKIAVITGGGSGIGRAIATLFAKQGATVHILELNEKAAEDAANQILTEGGQVVIHACTVAHQSEVKTAFDKIGKIDILINNAGVAHIGNAENTGEADFDRVFSVNVLEGNVHNGGRRSREDRSGGKAKPSHQLQSRFHGRAMWTKIVTTSNLTIPCAGRIF